MTIRYTLLADGSSDRVLTHILDWALLQSGRSFHFQSQWADPVVVSGAGGSLHKRISIALSMYPCDLLFVHRDSEADDPVRRLEEIEIAVERSRAQLRGCCAVIPVRMTEAWLLFDERAIRRAAGNPNGQVRLDLPPLKECETLRDPKATLHELLRLASGLTGRRARNFRPAQAAHRVASEIRGFDPLRRLHAFIEFERRLETALAGLLQGG